ncbi:MAG: hypothetical protein ACJ77Z_17370 [Thermoleophilaceae bacterium]
MSTPIARRAVDLEPRTPGRPGLALALAIACIPGVTVAWDLPAGGFWIGIPLAVAAIVVGLRARAADDGRGRGMATAAVVIGAFAIALTAIWTVVAALD